ncbi:hypothetical protein DYE48_19185 [Halobacillus trueperi]|uniref:Uncharacterized protein n=1 Tax=Halobacillus trueperi TaxID=156205 RepID=A0A3E0J036_9BACI|nr:hypothetical protein DYE48_19185 [Halobacillus trueperi]
MHEALNSVASVMGRITDENYDDVEEMKERRKPLGRGLKRFPMDYLSITYIVLEGMFSVLTFGIFKVKRRPFCLLTLLYMIWLVLTGQATAKKQNL